MLKRYQYLVLFILNLFCTSSFACLNDMTSTLKGDVPLYINYESDHTVPSGHLFLDAETYAQGMHKLDSLYARTKDPDYLSDKGLLLILQKQYQQAITLYLSLEEQHPGRYATAANLGTAYELIGQNEQALQWIQKAVELNPGSHMGSEWIHVNILKAKIKGPAAHTSPFLIQTDFGKDSVAQTTLSAAELKTLQDALFYQLNERISFIKPQDPIIAALFFDLGNVNLLLGKYVAARTCYRQAKEYGYTHPLADIRIQKADYLETHPEARPALSATPLSQTPYIAYIVAGLTVTILLLLIMFWIRRKTRKQHK